MHLKVYTNTLTGGNTPIKLEIPGLQYLRTKGESDEEFSDKIKERLQNGEGKKMVRDVKEIVKAKKGRELL